MPEQQSQQQKGGTTRRVSLRRPGTSYGLLWVMAAIVIMLAAMVLFSDDETQAEVRPSYAQQLAGP